MTVPAAESTSTLKSPTILPNTTPARLYEDAIRFDGGSITSDGAVAVLSGDKTGRSPKEKRVVRHAESERDVWWGDVNIPLEEASFLAVRQRAIDFLNSRQRLYTVDGYAGWDADHRLKVRVVCARPYHALFMRNMLIRPTADELATFGEPDFVIYNAGQQSADPNVAGVGSKTCVALAIERGEMVILGTQYAGEMKKGVFTLMNYLMPKRGVLSMHCSANEGPDGDVSLFFGLSGTGKTTLSADPRRRLIGDDEHCWSDTGVFNIEGGCYAKVIDIKRESEPEIFETTRRFGTILENVGIDPDTRRLNFADRTLTENTRAAYPIDAIPRADGGGVAGHPKNIIFLTYDAFGVLPPLARLSAEEAEYHFLQGYTSKVAGTEEGVGNAPRAVFSACFGAPFMPLPPKVYAKLLREKIRRHEVSCWLINTGMTGGPYGEGKRMPIAITRAIVAAVLLGKLAGVSTRDVPMFHLGIPASCPGVDSFLLDPRHTWADPASYDAKAEELANRFVENAQALP